MIAEPQPTPAAEADAPSALHLLAVEATRQLNICNACRYCEGLCAVYPALERRRVLDLADISHLANLCHDCRACYDACMYTPPHDYGVNIPEVLTSVRLMDYSRYVWPARPPRLLRGWTGLFSGAVTFSLILLFVAVLNSGFSGLVRDRGAGSPYDLVPYSVLLVLMLIPAVFAAVVMALAARRFWRETAPTGAARPAVTAAAITRAAWDALTLRYLRGGGAECTYPKEDVPSPQRRWLHSTTVYGFGLCVLSTVAAGIMQDVLGIDPPYPLISVPVLAGIAGGVGLILGCTGLLLLKAGAAQVTTVADMTIKDYGLLSALAFLALSGLATLLMRSTPPFGIVLLIHLAAVMLTFAAAPYSKFPHFMYRFLALVRDHLERVNEA